MAQDLSRVKLTFVETLEEAEECTRWLGERHERIAFDFETEGTNLGRDRVRLGQLGDSDRGFAFPATGPRSWYGHFANLLDGYDRCPVFAHNLIFDSSFGRRDGITVPEHVAHDSMVMAQLANSALPVGLKPTARRLIGQKAVAGEAVLKEAKKQQKWDWATTPLDFPPYWQYGALDPVLTCRVAEDLEPKVLPRYQQSYDIELGGIHVLRDAQLEGMRVDLDYCRQMSTYLEAQMQSLMPALPPDPKSGDPVNPDSPDQVVRWLQSRGAQLTKKTEKGKLAADDEVLTYWEKQGIQECHYVREYRKAGKLKSSYFDKLLDLETDSIVHPSIRVLGAQKTGRMSITDPALQTLPKSAVGRNAFLAREGCTLIAADFSGIEMRLLAHMAQDQQMIENFLAGIDQHSWTAEQIYHQSPPTVAQRDVAKRSGFAKIYGAGIPKFALSTGLSEPDAASFLDRYDALFPGVKRFQEQVAAEVHASGDKQWGEVHTEFGRRLQVPRDAAYKGVNYRDQGTAGEVLKLKLVELSNAGLGPFIRLPIHDEFIIEVPDQEVDDAVRVIKEVMPERKLFRVPLEIEVRTTKRWGDLYPA